MTHTRLFFALFVFCILSLVAVSCSNKAKKKVLTKEEYRQYRDPLIKANRGLVKLDKETIESYVERRKWNMQTTETGLWYMIYEKGDGQPVESGNVVEFGYEISLLDGTVCYSSDSLGTKKMRVGQGGVENGLEQGLLLLHQGDKAIFIMPPHLAHGLAGDLRRIPPRAVIVYKVDLIRLFKI